jgi:methanogenic corrinoid protein MtbC1
MRIVVALWDLRAEADRHRRRLAAAGADEVVATLAEAVLAIRLTPTREVDPVALCADLEKAFRDVDLAHAESLLAEAERLLPVEELAVEVLQPALEGLRDDLAAGRMTAEQEEVAGALLRQRVIALGEAAPQVQGYRALAASAPEEEEEIGLLILALLMRRAGWSVVHLGQRAADEGFGEVIASVQPHAILFSAVQRPSADRLLGLADGLHRQHPELLFVLDGPRFRPSAVARLDGAALRVGDDARDALAAIARRMPPLPPPPPPSEADLADEKAEHDGDPELDGDETQVGALRPPASGMYGVAKPGPAKPGPAKPDTPRAA